MLLVEYFRLVCDCLMLPGKNSGFLFLFLFLNQMLMSLAFLLNGETILLSCITLGDLENKVKALACWYMLKRTKWRSKVGPNNLDEIGAPCEQGNTLIWAQIILTYCVFSGKSNLMVIFDTGAFALVCFVFLNLLFWRRVLSYFNISKLNNACFVPF